MISCMVENCCWPWAAFRNFQCCLRSRSVKNNIERYKPSRKKTCIHGQGLLGHGCISIKKAIIAIAIIIAGSVTCSLHTVL